MRPSLIVGLLLIGLGALVLLTGGSFTSRENVLSVGDLQVTAEERRTVPTWAGVGAIVAGVVVLLAARSRKSA